AVARERGAGRVRVAAALEALRRASVRLVQARGAARARDGTSCTVAPRCARHALAAPNFMRAGRARYASGVPTVAGLDGASTAFGARARRGAAAGGN
ncbi:MAG: hypothetical protein CMK50_03025, partial [Propionibacteriaceae bacterium]|nr:hypothetical protein [Propionibacteriaceae bacterium]